MFEQITKYLTEKGWHFTSDKEKGAFQFHLSGQNGTFQCVALLDEQPKRLGFYSFCPANCPKDMIIKMAEFLMRLNSTFFYGSFELNFETGVVVCKTSLFCQDIELTATVLDNIFISNVSVLNDNLPIMLKLMYGNLSPLEALHERLGDQPQLEG